jgi:aspartate oxidase
VVAILIFGAGLLVLLTVLNKNIILAKKVQLQTQATFLAKEGIELVYNLRDSNTIKYYPWNYLSGTMDEIKNNTYKKIEV